MRSDWKTMGHVAHCKGLAKSKVNLRYRWRSSSNPWQTPLNTVLKFFAFFLETMHAMTYEKHLKELVQIMIQPESTPVYNSTRGELLCVVLKSQNFPAMLKSMWTIEANCSAWETRCSKTLHSFELCQTERTRFFVWWRVKNRVQFLNHRVVWIPCLQYLFLIPTKLLASLCELLQWKWWRSLDK